MSLRLRSSYRRAIGGFAIPVNSPSMGSLHRRRNGKCKVTAARTPTCGENLEVMPEALGQWHLWHAEIISRALANNHLQKLVRLKRVGGPHKPSGSCLCSMLESQRWCIAKDHQPEYFQCRKTHDLVFFF